MSYMNLDQNIVLFNQFGQPVIIPTRALLPSMQPLISQQVINQNGFQGQIYQQPYMCGYPPYHQRPVYTHVNEPIVTKEYQNEARQNAEKPNGKPFSIDELKSMMLPELFTTLNNLLINNNDKYKAIKINSMIVSLPDGFGVLVELVKVDGSILELTLVTQYVTENNSILLRIGSDDKEIHSVTETLPITQIGILSSLEKLFLGVIRVKENNE